MSPAAMQFSIFALAVCNIALSAVVCTLIRRVARLEGTLPPPQRERQRVWQ